MPPNTENLAEELTLNAGADEKTGEDTSQHPTRPASVEDMIGIWGPDWTEGLSSEDWIRQQRERTQL